MAEIGATLGNLVNTGVKVAVLPPFNSSVMVSAKIRWIFMEAYSVVKMCLILCNPMDYSLPVSSAHVWDFPGRNTGVGCHFLLQAIFLAKGSNLSL